MKARGHSQRRESTRRLLVALGAAVMMTACAGGSTGLVADKNMVGVTLSAVGHYGSTIGIPDFYVNGHWGGNNVGWGGGGGGVCCVLLPRKITKPVVVTVKWQSCDIGHIEFVNDRVVDPDGQCKLEDHEATVPIHFEVEPGNSSGLYVHFLPGHRIEVWVSLVGPAGPEYPGPRYPRGPAPRYPPLLGMVCRTRSAIAVERI